MCIRKCFALGDQSIHVNSRILSAFSNTANHNASLLFNSTFVGCNPKPKNNDGNVAKQIAKDGGFKEALKECKKGEKTFGKTGKNNEPWAIRLYDWSYARSEPLIEQFKKFDPDATGQITKGMSTLHCATRYKIIHFN